MLTVKATLEHEVATALLNMRHLAKDPKEINNYTLVQYFLSSLGVEYLFLGDVGFSLVEQSGASIAIKSSPGVYGVYDPEKALAFYNGDARLLFAEFVEVIRRLRIQPSILSAFERVFSEKVFGDEIVRKHCALMKFSAEKPFLLRVLFISVTRHLEMDVFRAKSELSEIKTACAQLHLSCEDALLESKTLVWYTCILYVEAEHLEQISHFYSQITDFAGDLQQTKQLLQQRLQQRICFYEQLVEMLLKPVELLLAEHELVFEGKRFRPQVVAAVATICSMIVRRYKVSDILAVERIMHEAVITEIIECVVEDAALLTVNFGCASDQILRNCALVRAKHTFVVEFLDKFAQIELFGENSQLEQYLRHAKDVSRLLSAVSRIEGLKQLFLLEPELFARETLDVLDSILVYFDKALSQANINLCCCVSDEIARFVRAGEFAEKAEICCPRGCTDFAKHSKLVACFVLWLKEFKASYSEEEIKLASLVAADVQRLSVRALLHYFGQLCAVFESGLVKLRFAYILDKALEEFMKLFKLPFDTVNQIDYLQQQLACTHLYLNAIPPQWFLDVFGVQVRLEKPHIFIEELAIALRRKYYTGSSDLRVQCRFANVAQFIMEFETFARISTETKQHFVTEKELEFKEAAESSLEDFKAAIFVAAENEQVEFRSLNASVALIDDFARYLVYRKMETTNAQISVYGQLTFEPPEVCWELLRVAQRYNILFNYKQLQFIYESRLNTKIDNLGQLAEQNQQLTWMEDVQLKELANQAAFLLSNSLMNNELFFEVIGECHTLVDEFYEQNPVETGNLAKLETEELELCKILYNTILRNAEFLEFPLADFDLKIQECYAVGANLPQGEPRGQTKYRRKQDNQLINKEAFRLFEHTIVKVKNYLNEMMYNVQNKIICSLAEINQQFYEQMQGELEQLVERLQKLIDDVQTLLLGLLLLFGTWATRPVFSILIIYDNGIEFEPKAHTIADALSVIKNSVRDLAEQAPVSGSSFSAKLQQWANMMLDLAYFSKEIEYDNNVLAESVSSPYIRIVVWINAICNLSVGLIEFLRAMHEQFEIEISISDESNAEPQNSVQLDFLRTKFELSPLNQMLLGKIQNAFETTDNFVSELGLRFEIFEQRIYSLQNVKYALEDIFVLQGEANQPISEDYVVIEQLTTLYNAVKDEQMLHGFFVEYDDFLKEMREYEHKINNIHLGFALVNASHLLAHHEQLMYEIVQHTTEPIVRYLEDNLKKSFSKFKTQLDGTSHIVKECTTESNVSLSNYERVEELIKSRFILECCFLMFERINDKCLEMSRYLTERNILIHTSIEQLQDEIGQSCLASELLFDTIDQLINNTRQVYLEYEHQVYHSLEESSMAVEHKSNDVMANASEIVQMLNTSGKATEIIKARVDLLFYFNKEQEQSKSELCKYYELMYLEGLTRLNLESDPAYFDHSELEQFVQREYTHSWHKQLIDTLEFKIELYEMLHTLIADYDKYFHSAITDFFANFTTLFETSKQMQRYCYELEQKTDDWHLRNEIMQVKLLVTELLEMLLEFQKYENLQPRHWFELIEQLEPRTSEAEIHRSKLLKSCHAEFMQIIPADIIMLRLHESEHISDIIAGANLENEFNALHELLIQSESAIFQEDELMELLQTVGKVETTFELVHLRGSNGATNILLHNVVHSNYEKIGEFIQQANVELPDTYEHFIQQLTQFMALFERNFQFCMNFDYESEIQRFISSFITAFTMCYVLRTNWVLVHIAFIVSFDTQPLEDETRSRISVLAKESFELFHQISGQNDESSSEFTMELLKLEFRQHTLVRDAIKHVRHGFELMSADLLQQNEYMVCLTPVFRRFEQISDIEVFQYFCKSTNLYSVGFELLVNERFLAELDEVLELHNFTGQNFINYLNKYCGDLSLLLHITDAQEEYADMSRFVEYLEHMNISAMFSFLDEIVLNYSTVVGVVFASQREYARVHSIDAQIVPLYRQLNAKQVAKVPSALFPFCSCHPILQLLVEFVLLLEESVTVYTAECVKTLREFIGLSTHYESTYSANVQNETEFPLKLFLYTECEKWRSTLFPEEVLLLAMQIVCDSALAVPHDIFENNDYALATPVEHCVYFNQKLKELKEALYDFISGFIQVRYGDVKAVVKKVFQIPHAYNKVRLLINISSQYIDLLEPIIGDKNSIAVAYTKQDSATLFAEKSFLLYFAESSSRDDLMSKYIIDSVNWPERVLNPEELVYVCGEQYSQNSVLGYLGLNDLHCFEKQNFCVLDRFAAKEFWLMLDELAVNKYTTNELVQCVNFAAIELYKDELECVSQVCQKVFSPGYDNPTINGEDAISLESKHFSMPKYELLGIKFLDELSFLIFTQIQPQQHSKSSYHHSQSVNYTSTFLSQSRNNQMTNEIFGAPLNERGESTSDIEDSENAEKIDYSLVFVFADAGWELLNQGANYGNVLFENAENCIVFEEEYSHMQISIIDSVLSFVYVASFYFTTDETFSANFYNYDFMQLRFCREIIEFLEGNIKIGEQFIYKNIGERVDVLLGRIYPFCFESLIEKRIPDCICLPWSLVQGTVRDSFLQYSFEVCSINVDEISRTVYQLMVQFIHLTACKLAVVQLRVAPIVYVSVFLNIMEQALQEYYGVSLRRLPEFLRCDGCSRRNELEIQVVDSISAEDVNMLRFNPPDRLLVVVLNMQALEIPTIEILSENQLVHARLVEHYISMKFNRLISTNNTFYEVASTDLINARVRHTCFSAEKLYIQETLAKRLASLSYFDRYYITAATNTLCECATETIQRFLEEIYATPTLSYEQTLEIEEHICEQVVRTAHAVLIVIYDAIGNKLTRIQFKFWNALVIFLSYHIAKQLNVPVQFLKEANIVQEKQTFLPSLLSVKSIGGAASGVADNEWQYYITRIVGDALMYKLQSDIQINKFFPMAEITDGQFTTRFVDTSKDVQGHSSPDSVVRILLLYTYQELNLDEAQSNEFLEFLTTNKEVEKFGLRQGMREFIFHQFIGGYSGFSAKPEKFSILKVADTPPTFPAAQFVHTSYNQISNYHTDELIICPNYAVVETPKNSMGINRFLIKTKTSEQFDAECNQLESSDSFAITISEILQHFVHEPFYFEVFQRRHDTCMLSVAMSRSLNVVFEVCYINNLIIEVENCVGIGVFEYIEQYQQYFKQLLYRYQTSTYIDAMCLAARESRLVLPLCVIFTKSFESEQLCEYELNYSQNSSLLLGRRRVSYNYTMVDQIVQPDVEALYLSELELDEFEVEKLLYYFEQKQSLEIVNARVDTLDYVECAIEACSGHLIVYERQDIAEFYISLCRAVLQQKTDIYVLILQVSDLPADALADILTTGYPRTAFLHEDINRDAELLLMFESIAGIKKKMSIPTLLSTHINGDSAVLDFIHFVVFNGENQRKPGVLQVNNEKLSDCKCQPAVPASQLRTLRNPTLFIKNVHDKLERRTEIQIAYYEEIIDCNSAIALKIKQKEAETIYSTERMLESQQLLANKKECESKERKLQRLHEEIAQQESELESVKNVIAEKQRNKDYYAMMIEQTHEFLRATVYNLQLLSRTGIQYVDKIDERLYQAIKYLLPNKQPVSGRGESLDKIIKQLIPCLDSLAQEQSSHLKTALQLETPDIRHFTDPNEQFRSQSTEKYEEAPIDYNIFALFDLAVQENGWRAYCGACHAELVKLRAEAQEAVLQIEELRAALKESELIVQELLQHIAREEQELTENQDLQDRQELELSHLHEVHHIYQRMATNALFSQQKSEGCKARLEYNTVLFSNYIQTQDPCNSKIQLYLEQKFGKCEVQNKNFFLAFAKQYYSTDALISLFKCNVQYGEHSNKLRITKNDILVTEDKLIFMLDDNLDNEEYFDQLFALFDNSIFSLEDALADNIIMCLDPDLTLLLAKIQNENESIAVDAENPQIGAYLARILENPNLMLYTEKETAEPIRIATNVDELQSHMLQPSRCENIVVIVREMEYEAVQALMHGRTRDCTYRFDYTTDEQLITTYREIIAPQPIRLVFEAPIDSVEDPYIAKYRIRKVQNEEVAEDSGQVHSVCARTIALLTDFIAKYEACKAFFDETVAKIRQDAEYSDINSSHNQYKVALRQLLAAAVQYKKYIVENIQ